jgi:YfiH family protein
LSSPRFRATELEGIELLQCSPLLEEGVPHGFTLRTGAFGSRENGERDRERLRRALGFSRLAGMHQLRNMSRSSRAVIQCDGLLTDEHEVGVFVQSADCVPLLLWASNAKAVAAVHAGWRGTLARIASRAVSRFHDVYGTSSEEIQAAIGPAVGVCCYEVGDEVISAFAESGRDIDRISRPGPRGRRHLDLAEENRAQLGSSGVAAERVYDSGLCTHCENDRFYSFRREGSAVGRIFGVIGLR